MRVTEAGRFELLKRELGRTATDMVSASEKLATGRAMTRLSDAPALAVQADRLLTEDRALTAYASAAENAKAWLSTQDGALQVASNLMQRVRELTISAGAPTGDQQREGIAIELEGLRSQLIDVANTSFNGRPVFGGFGDAAVSESGGVVSFVGDAGLVQRRVSEDRLVQVNISGLQAFGFDDADDVFAMISDIAADVRIGDADAISNAALTRIAATEDRLLGALGAVGARGNQVASAVTSATARSYEIQAYRSSIVDVDLAEVALELTLAQTAYEAVLAATARMQLPSLVDYLR